MSYTVLEAGCCRCSLRAFVAASDICTTTMHTIPSNSHFTAGHLGASTPHLILETVFPQRGRTPLYAAATSNNVAVAKMLIEKGATVDAAEKVSDRFRAVF